MVGRYEIVDELETMEIIDDGVYHPDLSTTSSNANSFRTLEPIISGPLTMKTIFFSPRWSTLQKRLCIGTVAIVSLGFVAVFIGLIAGLANVINYIEEAEKMKQSGLFMVPNVHNEVGMFFYNLPMKNYRSSTLVKKYVAEIESFLKMYENQNTTSYVTCNKKQVAEKGQFCKFDLNWLGTNCTKENKFGYQDGNPCILFGLRNLRSWGPIVTKEYFRSNEIRSEVSKDRLSALDTDHIPFSCKIMAHNFHTSPSFNADDYLTYYPEGGFRFLSTANRVESGENDLPPLVFLQLKNLQTIGKLHIQCRILAQNIKQLEGVRVLTFEYSDGTEESFDY